MERTVAAFGDFKAEDRVAGAELLQKEAARLRREDREAAKAAAEAVSDGEDDGEEDGEDEDEDDEDEDGEDGEEALVSDDDAEDASDSDEGELLSGEEGSDEEGSDEEGEEGSEEEEASGSEEFDPEEEDEYGRVVDPTTGRKRKFIQPALTLEQKRAMAERAVSEAEAKGERAPKVRKNGVLSLSELRRRHKTAAKERRAREAEEAETNAAHSDSEEDLVEHTRVLEPEDFRRIKALREAGKLDAAMEKVGAKKAKETAADASARGPFERRGSQGEPRRAHGGGAAEGARQGDEGGVRDGGARRPRGVWRQSGEEEQKVGGHQQCREEEEEEHAARGEGAGGGATAAG